MLTKIKNELIYLLTLRRILSSLKSINNDENSIITKRIASFADKSPDSIAIYFEEREITYKELINGANQYSHWFLDNGLQKGDVVALLMENRPEFLMAWIGIAQVGGTAALINTNLTGHPLNHSLSISGANKLILGKELVSNFETTDDTIKSSFQVWIEGDTDKTNYEKLNLALEKLSNIMPSINYNVTNEDVALFILQEQQEIPRLQL